MDPVPFDGSKLREDLIRLRRPHPQSQILGKFGITAKQAQAAIGVGFKTMLFMAWQMFLYMLRHFKRKRWGRDTKLCAGNSLMGRMLFSLKERNVPIWLNTGVEELVFEGRQGGRRSARQGGRDPSRESQPRRRPCGGRVFEEPRDASAVSAASDYDRMDGGHPVEHRGMPSSWGAMRAERSI